MNRPSITRAEGIALGALYAFTLFAALGYGIFALHPERLPDTEWARTFFQNAFAWNSRIHIVLTGLVLAVAFFQRVGVRWLVAFGSVFVLSFLAEHIGTGTGFPFSGYEYTGLLGPRIGERVPWVIPASWFFMSAPSWILARRTFPTRTLPRVLFATYLLVLWDVALDPAMSYLVTYWVWEVPGPYYTMPWVNFAGWALTGVVLMTTLEILDRWIDWAGDVTLTWSLVYYVAIVLMPLGMLVMAGAWWAVLLTLACAGVAAGIHLLFAERYPTAAPESHAVRAPEGVAGGAA